MNYGDDPEFYKEAKAGSPNSATLDRDLEELDDEAQDFVIAYCDLVEKCGSDFSISDVFFYLQMFKVPDAELFPGVVFRIRKVWNTKKAERVGRAERLKEALKAKFKVKGNKDGNRSAN